MKKKLESELVSIAHRILRLKGKEDVVAMHSEAKALYEQLTILKFVEEHFGALQPLVGKSEVVSKFEQLANKVLENNKQVPENNPHEEDIITPVMDTIKGMVAEMPKQESLDEILADILPEPAFVKSDAELVTPEIKKTESQHKKSSPSLNKSLNQSINVGLNDKLAFVKHLFNGSNEDFNRVISQLNTIDKEQDAVRFIDTIVKPDYNNWEGKEAYEERFMELVLFRFS